MMTIEEIETRIMACERAILKNTETMTALIENNLKISDGLLKMSELVRELINKES